MFSRKRGADSMPDYDPEPKRFFKGFKEQFSCNIKILVEPTICGKILGRKGDKIKSLQSDNKVKIAINKMNSLYPGTRLRVVIVSGNDPKGVAKALDFIVEKSYEEFNMRQDERKEMKLALSSTTVGMVLGKKGSAIQQVKKDSGVHFLGIANNEETLVPYEKLLTAGGSERSVSTAFHAIMEIVNRDQNNGQHPEIDYDSMGGGEDMMMGGGEWDYPGMGGGDFNGRGGFSGGRGLPSRGGPPARGGPGARGGLPPRGGLGARGGPPARGAPAARGLLGVRNGGPHMGGGEDGFESQGAGRQGGSDGLLGMLGLDMKIRIPESGIGKPLMGKPLLQLLDHVDDKLKQTAYSPPEIKYIKTGIADFASLGLLSLGLADAPSSNGFEGGASGNGFGAGREDLYSRRTMEQGGGRPGPYSSYPAHSNWK